MSNATGTDDIPSNNDGDNESDDNRTALHLFGAVMSNIFLFFLIFGLSATVECRSLRKQITNKFAIGTGVIMQYLFMPVLGCVSVVSFTRLGLPHAVALSLMVVTSSPGGSYSNWFCSTFNADLALSVAMTTISSLLSVVMLPLNLFLYTWLAFSGQTQSSDVIKSIDFKSLFISLGIVLAAILSGLYAGYRYDTPRFHSISNKLGTLSGICLILFSIFVSSGASGAESTFINQHWTFYVAVILPCLGGMFLANIGSRLIGLSPPEVVAIAIECCYQNTGIATSVAITMFNNKEERAQAVAVPLFYGIVEAVAIFVFCIFSWKMGWTKAPPNENFCVMLTTCYELADENDEDDRQDADISSIDDDGNGCRLSENNDDDIEKTKVNNYEVIGLNTELPSDTKSITTPYKRKQSDFTSETTRSDGSSISGTCTMSPLTPTAFDASPISPSPLISVIIEASHHEEENLTIDSNGKSTQE